MKRISKQSLTMRRYGQFTITTVPGTPHCGVADKVSIKYKMACTCSVTSLDERGFLFDQMGVANFFKQQEKKPVSISCEQYAIQCSRTLFAKIMDENPKCKVEHIALELEPLSPDYPNSGASMTFEYTMGG